MYIRLIAIELFPLVFDSMGKPASGLMEASLAFLGFYSECVSTQAPARPANNLSMPSSQPFHGQYCMANIQLANSALSAFQVRHQNE